MAERDERALREALEALSPDEPVDPVAARHRAAERRRNGRALAGIAVALVLVAGVVGLPRLLPTDTGAQAGGSAEAGQPGGTAEAGQPQADQDAERDPATPPSRRTLKPPTDPAPEGWRTEYYRDISFQVPADWGYSMPPSPASWCASSKDGKPRPEQLKPYVWLRTLAVAEPAIACGPMPDSLLTEHVVALEPGPAEDHVEGSHQVAGWWVVTRFVGSAILIVTTGDRTRAEQILDSSTVVTDDTPCPPSSAVAGPLGTRPGEPTDLIALGNVDHVVLCQYEVDDGPVAGRSRLRAAHLVTGRPADRLIAELQAAPVNDTSCDPPPPDGLPEIAVLARVTAGDRTSDIHIAATGCPDGDRGMAGGIDDGTTLRLLTREACRLVLTPPIALFTGSGDVGRNCLG
jgi:hypothetical protein